MLMWDLICRVLAHPRDYFGVLKTHHLTFIKKQEESNGVTTFYFQANPPFTWKPGQHALFFPHARITGKSYRVFSIASTPAEGLIMISTTTSPNPSPFKIHLLSLAPGDLLTIRGPIGEFHVRPGQKTIVGVAGGIGITPFRSLLLSQSAATTPHIHLIYGGKNGQHLYREELEHIATGSNITIEFVLTPEEVTAAIAAQVALHKNEADYYISGSPGMITAIRASLTTQGIRSIVSDPFKGY